MILSLKIVFYLFSIVIPFEINLDLTDWTNINEIHNDQEHDCIHISICTELGKDYNEIVSYCMSEWPSKWNIEKDKNLSQFTFDQLSKLNISSQQLYDWSAPMDIIESYQFYLDQLSISNETYLSKKIFSNCTLPRFGSFCEYSFDSFKSNHLSLNDLICDLYLTNDYTTNDKTCYIHLKCDLGSELLCLDWTNICDGYVQCIDGIDEEYCWLLEINVCQENEYRCRNGQCIPLIYLDDNIFGAECLDESDIHMNAIKNPSIIQRTSLLLEPIMRREDIMCLAGSYDTGTFNLYCKLERFISSVRLMISLKDKQMTDICWNAFQCYIHLDTALNPNCSEICKNDLCQKLIKDHCPDMFFIPSIPIAFGHIYLALTKEHIIEENNSIYKPEYICYNDKLCNEFNPNKEKILFNGTTCRRVEDFKFLPEPSETGIETIYNYIIDIHLFLVQCNTIRRNDSEFCMNSMLYQCKNSSKCISKNNIFDHRPDCDYQDDEDTQQKILIDEICLKETLPMHFKCSTGDICISRKLIRDFHCNCKGPDNNELYCEDEDITSKSIRKVISFPTICDGFNDLDPIIIDQKNYTDETECDLWLCNNSYTRCNGYWNCFNGIDEIGCFPSLLSIYNCSSNDHLCISSKTKNFMCLSLNKSNDGKIDCYGGTDEPYVCRNNSMNYGMGFYSDNEIDVRFSCFSSLQLCNGVNHSDIGADEDEQFCKIINTSNLFYGGNCQRENSFNLPESDQFLCNLFKLTPLYETVHFSLGQTEISKNDESLSLSMNEKRSIEVDECNRGVKINVWSINSSSMTCLCPRSYYGDKCQYQNQRVSLTIRFQSFSDSWQTPFIIIVSLIDDSDERIIHSYEQINYLPMQNCQTKYNMHLLYSNRPKNESKKYFIHIDIYERLFLLYRGSLLIDIPFLFLPIQRLAVLLNIPQVNHHLKSSKDSQCIHGQWIEYFNNPENAKFCQCYQGWTGRFCSIEHECNCSSDSLCLGTSSNHRSICVCPINKWGSRCLLTDKICQLNRSCENQGQCIPISQHVASKKTFQCICLNGYSGERCQIKSNELIISFSNDLILPETMLIHFIEIKQNNFPEKGILFKKLSLNRNPLNIYWSRPFHIAFIELNNNKYYLIAVQQIYNKSQKIERKIGSSDFCPHIKQIFNETFIKLHLIRRIKSYHLPRRNSSQQWSCFYDDDYFCLCVQFGDQRQANCLQFNHTLKHDCLGKNTCQNDGQCLQDNTNCPQTYMCICPICFYGTQCQFSSNGYSLSLDAILGYHIQPHINIIYQPIIVKISLIITVIITVIGFINGICSIITFNNRILWKNACGIYLFVSSMTTLFTITIFFIKFVILLISQMRYLTNRSFLHFQCITIDYFLRNGLYMDQWLNTCIALERAITSIKGINFNKNKSKKLSKYILLLFSFFIVSTNITDPIHRRLIDENNNDENRIWCIVSYSKNIQIFNVIMHSFNFFVPFIINLISTIIIIIKTARHRSSIKTSQTYKQHLIEQFKHHKHLLISSILLVILAIPRLIITFATGCMKSAADSWWFLMGYFISFFPSMLTFFIFVLPSKMYVQEFHNTIKRYRKTIQSRFH